MSVERIVTIFVEDNILIRVTKNKEDADIIISSGKKEVAIVKEADTAIMEYLLSNNISPNAGGFTYLVMAINIVTEKLANQKRYSLTKDVYPMVAQNFSVSQVSVERAIWNAIDSSKAKGIGTKRFIEKYRLGV